MKKEERQAIIDGGDVDELPLGDNDDIMDMPLRDNDEQRAPAKAEKVTDKRDDEPLFCPEDIEDINGVFPDSRPEPEPQPEPQPEPAQEPEAPAPAEAAEAPAAEGEQPQAETADAAPQVEENKEYTTDFRE